MAAKVFSIVSYVIAGFFVYMVEVLAFAHLPAVFAKIGLMVGFSVPALVALCAGFALAGFGIKLRDTGIVLLSSTGFTTMLVLTMVCILSTEEFQPMMKPETREFFSAYGFGFGFLGGVLSLGLVSLVMGVRKPKPSEAL